MYDPKGRGCACMDSFDCDKMHARNNALWKALEWAAGELRTVGYPNAAELAMNMADDVPQTTLVKGSEK